MLADLTPAGPPTSVCTSTATSIIPRSRSFHKLLALQKLRTKRPPTWLAQDADLAQLPQSVLRSVPQSALQPNADVPEESPSVPESPAESTPLGTQFVDLPVEIHEGIIDHLYGILGSTSSSAGGSVHVLKNWSNAMRHPRRRQLSDLTLVSPTWRRIIQERLYRHIKIKGTKAGLEECGDWFLLHTHLQPYIRHIEVWVPVWEKRAGNCTHLMGSDPSPTGRHVVSTLVNTNTTTYEETININLAYRLASHNATISEIFHCIKCLFPEACILTIEGGHCKKPPMIHHFRETPPPQSTTPHLAVLPHIRTLILKGAWNIMRSEAHFRNLSVALPHLREWHCTYAKPKTAAHQTIHAVLTHSFPPTLTHLNLCLEGFYGKESASPHKWRALYASHHICLALGRIAPQLEALTFTGRVCGTFFTAACHAATRNGGSSRLRSLDLVVRNCCRPAGVWDDGTGIANWAFIQAFEALVVEGVRSLGTLKRLAVLRVRFVDLDTPCPLLNPFFALVGGRCEGVWSEEILGALEVARPGVGFVGGGGRGGGDW
ncbi:MAG: hypothetical protein FRX48_05713 [Lasallia pustulata]|uniref:Uncharacterized protein n=1 Tax=Lasallia pustulata TaxID=136370 RepID=A0A5M8PP59_9LECA|nr:MAG: hypothetical protein FRX48_05713 [Lasallia pustulata]